MQTYTQCRLRRGRTEQIAWIPSEFAKKNQFLRIKSEDGWRVIGMGATMPESYVTGTSGTIARRSPASSCVPEDYGVAEMERREFLKLVYVGSNPTSVAILKSLTRSTLES